MIKILEVLQLFGKHIDIMRPLDVEYWVGALLRNLKIHYKIFVCPNTYMGNEMLSIELGGLMMLHYYKCD